MGVGALTTSHAAAAALLVDVRKPDGVRTAHVQSFARTVRCENRGNSERVIIQEAVGRFAASAALAVCCSVTWPSTAAHPPSFTTHQARVLASVPTPPRNQWMHLSDATALPAECTTSPPLVALSQRPDSGEVTNQSIVAEAWLVVNEKFLDARHHRWSEDTWLKKREEVLKRSAPSRMAAYNIIRNMLSDLNDPYTRFITPSELQQLSKYDMTGIGLSLGETGTRDNTTSLRVIGVVLGSPAQLAGVNQGDELLSVNGVDVYGKSAFEASSLIQGAKGTLVSIEVRHEPCKDTQQFLIERQQSVQTPVYYRLEHRAGDAIGYIRVKELNAVAKRDMVTAMNKLTEAGATSFLLDLRDNPGGLVQAGIEIAKVFLNEGDTVVYTVGKDSETHKRIFAKNPPLTEAPLMVLVNERTASASEIVAAALHDNCRAVLIGHRTFGKGLIQSVFELSDGSGVILTAGKYVTPRHQDIDGNGISPDFQNLPGLANVKQKLQTCSHPD